MVQAIIILSFHHSLACLCISNGIYQEQDYLFFNRNTSSTDKDIHGKIEKTQPESQALRALKGSHILNYLKNYSSDTEKDETKESEEQRQNRRESNKNRKDKRKDDVLETEGSIDITKIIFSLDFCEKFLLFEKNEVKFCLENFDWHQFKGLKSYVICYL